MSIEERKLRLIENIINEKDDAILNKLERIFRWEKWPESQRKTAHDFASILTKEEAEAMQKVVDEYEGCGHADCLYHALC